MIAGVCEPNPLVYKKQTNKQTKHTHTHKTTATTPQQKERKRNRREHAHTHTSQDEEEHKANQGRSTTPRSELQYGRQRNHKPTNPEHAGELVKEPNRLRNDSIRIRTDHTVGDTLLAGERLQAELLPGWEDVRRRKTDPRIVLIAHLHQGHTQ
jgi:hypothetical protein